MADRWGGLSVAVWFTVLLLPHAVHAELEQSRQIILDPANEFHDSYFSQPVEMSSGSEQPLHTDPFNPTRLAKDPDYRRQPYGWLKTDEGLRWIGSFVTLGQWAEHVFAYYDLNHTGAALVPVRNSNPPVALWELFSDPEHPSQPYGIAAAKTADVYVAILETKDDKDPTLRHIDIQRFSRYGKLEWSYRYPSPTNQSTHPSSSHIDISDDGDTILATVYDAQHDRNEALIFRPNVPWPVKRYVFEGGIVWKVDLSGDGQVFVVGVNTLWYVMEIKTGVVRYQLDTLIQLGGPGVALSRDGTTLVKSDSVSGGYFQIFTWDGVQYLLKHVVVSPIGGLYRTFAISDDGTTVAAGIGLPWPSTLCRVEAIDLDSGRLLMGETPFSVPGPRTYQNLVMDVAISADGNRLIAGLLGDEERHPLVEEIRVYETTSAVPIFKKNLRGSAIDVDISPDGTWVVVGSKAVHLNELGSGGQYDLSYIP